MRVPADPAPSVAGATEGRVGASPVAAVDTHHHYVPPVLREALAARAAQDAAFAAQFAAVVEVFASALDDGDGRLVEMDAAGVETAVIAAPPPGAEVVAAAQRPAFARRVNEELLALARRHPGRFLVSMCLPLPNAAEAAAECARLGGEPEVRAVSLFAHLDGPPLDAPEMDVVYAACAARRLAVLLHPGMDRVSPLFSDWQLASALGAPLSTTLAAVRLALSGTLDRHGALDVVVPHLGGIAPYLLQRLEDQSSPGGAEHGLGHYFRERFFLDSCSFHPPALLCADASVGAARLLLGSDYPFRGPVGRAVGDLAVLADDERRAVARGNAQRWFGSDKPS